MRVVLDTNVLVSAVAFGGLPREVVKAAAVGLVRPVTSTEALGELERVLVAKLAFSPSAARLALSEIESISEIVQPAVIEPVCRDPEDDVFLATAVAGDAEAIISGDQDLLALGSYGVVRIMSPRRLLELLERA